MMTLIQFERGNIPSFDDALDGTSKSRPFSNCLTLTNEDFANFLHRDKDHIAIAFGMWWASKVCKVGKKVSYLFSDGVDHDRVNGGGFLWGEYRFGVDFQRCVTVATFFGILLIQVIVQRVSLRFFGEGNTIIMSPWRVIVQMMSPAGVLLFS